MIGGTGRKVVELRVVIGVVVLPVVGTVVCWYDGRGLAGPLIFSQGYADANAKTIKVRAVCRWISLVGLCWNRKGLGGERTGNTCCGVSEPCWADSKALGMGPQIDKKKG